MCIFCAYSVIIFVYISYQDMSVLCVYVVIICDHDMPCSLQQENHEGTFLCDDEGEDVAGRAAPRTAPSEHTDVVGGGTHLYEGGLRLVGADAPDPLGGVPCCCGAGDHWDISMKSSGVQQLLWSSGTWTVNVEMYLCIANVSTFF